MPGVLLGKQAFKCYLQSSFGSDFQVIATLNVLTTMSYVYSSDETLTARTTDEN